MDAYITSLLHPDRLTARLEIFKALTIPSIAAQQVADCELHWLILISDLLPTDHLNQLKAALAAVEDAGVAVSLLTVAANEANADPNEHLYAGMGMAIRLTLQRDLADRESLFATVRIDDDDALARQYSQRLSQYLRPEFVGFHASFPLGLQGIIANGEVTDARIIHREQIALGLAFINRYSGNDFSHPAIHVHGFGNHSEIYAKTPLVVDAMQASYLRGLSDENDLGDPKHSKHRPADQAAIAQLGMSWVNIHPAVEAHAAQSKPPKRRTWLGR